jgi:hypothetical protein
LNVPSGGGVAALLQIERAVACSPLAARRSLSRDKTFWTADFSILYFSLFWLVRSP